MNLSIRQADISDLKIICALGVTTFYEAYFEQDDPRDLADYVLENFSFERIESELQDKNSTFFLAQMENYTVGYAKLRENSRVECLKDVEAIELQRIYILEKAKGKGVGERLMKCCFDRARAKNYKTIWLSVWERNLAAQRFYERFGFVKAGEHQFPYGSTVGTNFVLRLDLT
jgi:diamine N-acetyltransferase